MYEMDGKQYLLVPAAGAAAAAAAPYLPHPVRPRRWAGSPTRFPRNDRKSTNYRTGSCPSGQVQGSRLRLCFAVAVLEGLDIQAMGVAAPRLAAELQLPGGVLGSGTFLEQHRSCCRRNSGRLACRQDRPEASAHRVCPPFRSIHSWHNVCVQLRVLVRECVWAPDWASAAH